MRRSAANSAKDVQSIGSVTKGATTTARVRISSSNQGKAEQGRRFENEDDPHPHPADALITTYFHRASEQRDARQNATRQVEGEHTEREKFTNHRISSTISNNYDKLRSHKQKHVV